jgi:hypothetical protein
MLGLLEGIDVLVPDQSDTIDHAYMENSPVSSASFCNSTFRASLERHGCPQRRR